MSRVLKSPLPWIFGFMMVFTLIIQPAAENPEVRSLLTKNFAASAALFFGIPSAIWGAVLYFRRNSGRALGPSVLAWGVYSVSALAYVVWVSFQQVPSEALPQRVAPSSPDVIQSTCTRNPGTGFLRCRDERGNLDKGVQSYRVERD